MMKRCLFFLIAIEILATTTAQNSDETITLMNCVECMDYFEQEVNSDEMVQLVLSCRIVPEIGDSSGIRKQFYGNFPEKNLPGVTSIFLMTQDNEDILFVILRKDITGETRAMYILTQHVWLQSVDMQEFYYFDELLWLSRYGDFDEFYRPVLKKNELFR